MHPTTIILYILIIAFSCFAFFAVQCVRVVVYPFPRPVVLNHVMIHGVPNCDGKGGCRVFLKIYINMKLEYTSGLQ